MHSFSILSFASSSLCCPTPLALLCVFLLVLMQWLIWVAYTFLQSVRPYAQARSEDKNAEFSPLALFSFFVNCCKENLHILLCMSPIGDAFRNRLRQFPALINCCTIDWFQVSLPMVSAFYYVVEKCTSYLSEKSFQRCSTVPEADILLRQWPWPSAANFPRPDSFTSLTLPVPFIPFYFEFYFTH